MQTERRPPQAAPAAMAFNAEDSMSGIDGYEKIKLVRHACPGAA